MSEWLDMKYAPKDGTRIIIRIEGLIPIEAYWGGGEDKAFREWASCRQIQEKMIGWKL